MPHVSQPPHETHSKATLDAAYANADAVTAANLVSHSSSSCSVLCHFRVAGNFLSDWSSIVGIASTALAGAAAASAFVPGFEWAAPVLGEASTVLGLASAGLAFAAGSAYILGGDWRDAGINIFAGTLGVALGGAGLVGAKFGSRALEGGLGGYVGDMGTRAVKASGGRYTQEAADRDTNVAIFGFNMPVVGLSYAGIDTDPDQDPEGSGRW